MQEMYTIQLHGDLRIAGVPCRAGHDMRVMHDPPFLRISSARLAERYLAPVGWGARVACERDTQLVLDGWLRVRAVAFTPVESLVIRGFPVAAGHPVSLIPYDENGTLSRDHRIGWLDVPAGSRFEIDPDDPSYVYATLARDVKIGAHVVAAGALVRVARRRSSAFIDVIIAGTRTRIDRAGRVLSA